VRCLLVSHFHWDREWYRTFEAYRGRLVDAVDRVLELLASDPGWRFVLDGQAIVVEDYLAVRPDRRDEIARRVGEGRLSVGPWYVQPDSLLPAGEAHVRNLLEGRRVAGALGPVSRVAYVPDSFGHPAQLPQLFAGFGLSPFVYWRGSGDELDALGARWLWVAPDGSTVEALCLREGYFNAAGLPADAE
jgi:alpha-mannosidase